MVRYTRTVQIHWYYTQFYLQMNLEFRVIIETLSIHFKDTPGVEHHNYFGQTAGVNMEMIQHYSGWKSPTVAQ